MAGGAKRSLLIADIGGTNARFAVAAQDGTFLARRTYQTAEHPTVEAAARHFLAEADLAPESAAIAAAGPLKDGAIQLTNAAWRLERADLMRRFGFQDVLLVNDMVAFAAGASIAPTTARTVVRPSPAGGATLVFALGTGLGTAWLETIGGRTFVHASEAGHTLLTPFDEDEARAFSAVGAGGAVTAEAICSGIGLPLLFRSLGVRPSPAGAPRATQILAHAADPANTAEAAVARIAARALATAARNAAHVIAGASRILLGGTVGTALAPHLERAGFFERLAGPPPSPLDLGAIGLETVSGDDLALEGLIALAEGRVAIMTGGK